MTKVQAREIFRKLGLQPAVIRMNDGNEYSVPHPNFVVVSSASTLHVYEPSPGDPNYPDFKFAVVALHDVKTIEARPDDAAF